MRAKPFVMFYSIFMFIMIASCDDGTKKKTIDPCAEVTCEEWEQCSEGSCETLEGRCANYTDCADDMFCDDALHVCRGPVEPGDDFLDDLPGNSVAFSFAGLINDDPAVNPSPTLGTASYTFDIEDLSGVLNEYAYAFAYHFPDDYPDPDAAGKDGIFLGASKIYDQQGADVFYYHFNWTVETAVLNAALTADDPLLEAPTLLRFRLMDVNQYIRQWDQVLFRRYCTISQYDETSAAGTLFLHFYDNTGFAVGEDLRVWGNLPLTARVTITPENEEEHCLYRIENDYVTRAEYEAERAITEPTLSCGIPEGFFGGSGTWHLDYFFSGELNPADATLETAVSGYGDATALLTEEVVVDDYNSVALAMTDQGGEPVTYAQSIGGVESLGTEHYLFHILGVSIHTATLQAMKEAQSTVTPWDGAHMTAIMESYEQLVVDGAGYARVCPVAITADDAAGELLACSGGNTDWSEGERLELALSVSWTGDPAVIAAAYGYAEGQSCHCLRENTVIDCAEFDALLAGR